MVPSPAPLHTTRYPNTVITSPANINDNLTNNLNYKDNSKSPMAQVNPKFFIDLKDIQEELISAKEEL